jgi:signal transduction histidine kinase
MQAALEPFNRLSLAVKFSLISLAVMVISGFGLGWWVALEIERGVVQRSASNMALFVENYLQPELQELNTRKTLSPVNTVALDSLLKDTTLGQQIVRFKVWGRDGLVLYSTEVAQMGQRFAVDGDLREAWSGQVSADISTLDRPENVGESKLRPRLLETYVPVRQRGGARVLAVVEFYALMDDLEQELAVARGRSWLIVGLATLGTYLMLIGLVKRGSDTIVRQQRTLNDSLLELRGLLEQNETLTTRVRRAATRTTALNERFLRRTSAELHDGPTQDLSYALMQLDGVLQHATQTQVVPVQGFVKELAGIEGSLNRAVSEIRSIARGLRMPELEALTLPEVVERAVRDHLRRTESQVTTTIAALEERVPLPVKITVFRIAQEALNNAFRHGGGLRQQIVLRRECPQHFVLEVADAGPGFDWNDRTHNEDHLGLIGMRERVESLGGTFVVISGPQQGTVIQAKIPYHPE